MSSIIKVVVDLPLRKLNKEYDYLLPENLAGEIKVGHIVKVPFGRRKIAAFVTKTNAESDIDKDKIKEIDSLLYKQSFFDQKMLALFHWTAAYYHAYLAQVIKSALPPGITDKKIKKQKIRYLKLNKTDNIQQELNNLEKRAPKQFLILDYIFKNQNQKLKLKEVLNYAETSKQTVDRLIDKNLILLYNNTEDRIPEIDNNLDYQIDELKLNRKLSSGEQEALTEIFDSNFENENNKYLLHTNIYDRKFNLIFKLIKKAVKNEDNIILLIPEIEKDYLILEKLKERFKKNIAFLHSKLSEGERFDEWQRIKKGEVQLAVGARSAIFAPFKKIDMIIILEENNENYKQQEHPLYHARQIAVKRLKEQKGILLLESPFPSIESKYYADKGIYNEFDFSGSESKVNTKIIDMKKEIEKGNIGDLSHDLKLQIENYLRENKKILLFLNRRGSANYLICRKCGHVIKCNNCDISLNYHQNEELLSCHYCGFKKEVPDICPECGSSFVSTAGVGTENLISQLKNNFEDAVIARVDSDQQKDKADQLLNNFNKNKIDILIGTSLIIKNNFYDNLNLLAVISADTALNSSDFRSAENNFTLLKGLKSLLKNNDKSKFLIQSYEPDHYSIQTAAVDDNYSFYSQEKEIREKRNYPPFCRLLNIVISGKSEKKVKEKSKELCKYLDRYSDKYIEKLGAVPAVLSKIRNKYRWQIILKFDSARNREYIIQIMEKQFINDDNNGSIQIRIDVDPYQML